MDIIVEGAAGQLRWQSPHPFPSLPPSHPDPTPRPGGDSQGPTHPTILIQCPLIIGLWGSPPPLELTVCRGHPPTDINQVSQT